jgi:hypothetical protein
MVKTTPRFRFHVQIDSDFWIGIQKHVLCGFMSKCLYTSSKHNELPGYNATGSCLVHSTMVRFMTLGASPHRCHGFAGVRKYGKDFKAIAEVIGTKTEAHVRTFFVNYRRRYNLDAVLRDFEAENGPVVDLELEPGLKEDKVPGTGAQTVLDTLPLTDVHRPC